MHFVSREPNRIMKNFPKGPQLGPILTLSNQLKTPYVFCHSSGRKANNHGKGTMID